MPLNRETRRAPSYGAGFSKAAKMTAGSDDTKGADPNKGILDLARNVGAWYSEGNLSGQVPCYGQKTRAA